MNLIYSTEQRLPEGSDYEMGSSEANTVWQEARDSY